MLMILVTKPLLMRAKFKSTMKEKESKVRMVRSAKIVDLVAMANVVVAEDAAEVEPVVVRLRIPIRVTVLSNNSAMMVLEMKVTSLDSVVVVVVVEIVAVVVIVAITEDPAETTTEKYVTIETTIDVELLATIATTVMIDATTVVMTTMIDTITTIAITVMTVMIAMTTTIVMIVTKT